MLIKYLIYINPKPKTMKRSTFLLLMCFMICIKLYSQVSVNSDGSEAENSAILELKSTNKGFLPPRMTQEQIGEITSPADGLIVYCITDGKLYIYNGSSYQWKEVSFGTATITPQFACGMPIIKSHIIGDIAPVSKTVTYGTVIDIPGENSKCWITSNLGADHQATVSDDATEASAGWYWQFNRMQGYKHDGTDRTPNNNWINWITEDFDWQAINDPCTQELGESWRIPTYTDWINVDANGNWVDWSGPWNSVLKIHAAGYLDESDGSLFDRGVGGYFWSSSQNDNLLGWNLSFNNSSCYMGESFKFYGVSIRCMRD